MHFGLIGIVQAWNVAVNILGRETLLRGSLLLSMQMRQQNLHPFLFPQVDGKADCQTENNYY